MNQADKPRRGRPPKPVPPTVPLPPRVIEVWDERFARPVHVGTHANVPRSWRASDILERYGIGVHLAVYDIGPHSREVINPGKQKP